MARKKGFVGTVSHLLQAANFKVQPGRFVALVSIYSILLAVGLFVLLFIFAKYSAIMAGLASAASFGIFNVTAYTWVFMVADARSRAIVRSLPDALQYISTQIRAGMTVDKAILLAAKPEFGPLQEELEKVSNDVLSGDPLDFALLNSAGRVKSPLYSKTIDLLVSGIRSGGQLAKILEHTANDIQNQLLLQKEIAANVGMQANFILFAATLGAPLLLGLSSFISEILATKLSASAGLSAIQGAAVKMPFSVTGGAQIPASFIFNFALVSIITTNFFAALILGVIKSGKEKYGFKYIPVLLAISLALFFLVRHFMAQTFGQLL